MAQSITQKAVNNFVRGLITEAAELTFPESASTDELNCDLRRDGTRRRRLGVEREEDYGDSAFQIFDTTRVANGDWFNVAGNPELEFLVVQVDNILFFYDKNQLPYSRQQKAYGIDLTPYEHSASLGAENSDCQFTSIKGKLVVSSSEINTIVVDYDEATQTFSVTQINFRVRDFEFQAPDTSAYFFPTTAVSETRVYDTLNSGWAEANNGRPGTNALSYYYSTRSNAYPPLTIPWFAGKDSDSLQDTNEFEKIGGGTSLSGNGHYILDFFNQDRRLAVASDSGVYGWAINFGLNKIINSRFSCVESFSGRVFYAGLNSSEDSGKVLFSKVIESNNDFGVCHQLNDPTSEYFSDLLSTDGGVIDIPDAINIKKLYASQSSIFVFAENGVWQINGVDGVFSATAYSVNRVSRIGILSAGSFVAAESTPFWWSRFGIHTLTSDPVSGQGSEQNLTIPTIQSFWDEIGVDEKQKVKGVYDSINKKIYWAYPNNDEPLQSKINNFLILDIPLGAFYPWKISDQIPLPGFPRTDYVVGVAFYSGYGSEGRLDNLVLNTGDNVVISTGENVVVEIPTDVKTGDAAIVLLTRQITDRMTMAAFRSTEFLDWPETNRPGPYSSYAETGYDFIGDLTVKKNAPYLVVYSRLTEEGFTGNEVDGYETIRPSSLLVSTSWDFKETFTTPQQAYRLKQTVVVNPNDLTEFDYPDSVITTRLKLRGHGRSMRIRYESEPGKDFLLLGWGIIQSRNPRY
jgi:hypothetical protein